MSCYNLQIYSSYITSYIDQDNHSKETWEFNVDEAKLVKYYLCDSFFIFSAKARS